MQICSKCKKEMQCTCTGKLSVWGTTHVYAGDEFTCSSCGSIVINTNSTAFFEPDVNKLLDMGNKVLWMNKKPEREEKYPNTGNLLQQKVK